MKLEEQVDMIEFKDYGEIDLDETPVVALACGHFFTAETLDGMVALNSVYTMDTKTGKSDGLQEISSTLAPAVPKCPHCNKPIRQYATQRYNRLINSAVIDEMTKRFIATGQTELHGAEAAFLKAAQRLEETRSEFTKTFSQTNSIAARSLIMAALRSRYKQAAQVKYSVSQLQHRAAERHQPAHKLHEATVYALQKHEPIEERMARVGFEQVTISGERDHRITLGAKMLKIKIDCIITEDKLGVLSATKAECRESATSLIFPDGSLQGSTKLVLKKCREFIKDCTNRALPRLVVEASLYFARIARIWQTIGSEQRELASKYHAKAKKLLTEAKVLCGKGFRDADTLSVAVDKSLKLLRREWYEEVSSAELEAIKKAMVGRLGGIATHSGH